MVVPELDMLLICYETFVQLSSISPRIHISHLLFLNFPVPGCFIHDSNIHSCCCVAFKK